MASERTLIKRFKHYTFSDDNVCYFGIALITKPFNPKILAEHAKKEGLAQRLGYLAEICAEAARDTHIPEQHKLNNLYKALEDSFTEWQYLCPNLPDWGKRMIKGRVENGDLNKPVRKKWKIYSALEPEEIEDWIDLYVTRDYLKFSPAERDDMAKKGIKYTRLTKRNVREKTAY